MEPEPVIPSALSYSPPVQLNRLTILHRVAWWCGVAPMVIGVSIFLLWLATEARFLESLGLLTIVGGCGLFAIGGICLMIYAWREFSGRFASPVNIVRRCIFPAAMLILNFPVAFAVASGVEYVSQRCDVRIMNTGSVAIDRFEIKSTGFTKDLGPMPPNTTVRYRRHVDDFGPINYTMIRNGLKTTGVLNGGYDTDDGEDGFLTATVDDNGIVKAP